MTENYRSRVYEKLKKGVEVRGYTLGERLSKSKGVSGSFVYKGEKDGKPVALKVGSYGFLDSFEGDDIEKLEDFRRREREVLQLAGNHPNIPSYVDSYTIEGDDFYPEPIGVLAMEYLDLPSVAQKIMKKERATEEEAKILLRDGLSALKHLHTGLPYQVLHRDVKPANVLLNHSKAYLIDFDIVKQGDDDATSATTIDTAGYYPIDAFKGHPNPSHDLVALGNVAIAGISGKDIKTIRTEQNRFQLDEVSTDGLLVSQPYREFIAKLIEDPKRRFQTAGEALGELEKRLGTSLPVVVQTAKEEIKENFNSASKYEDKQRNHIKIEKSVTGKNNIFFVDSAGDRYKSGIKETSVYETAKSIIEKYSGLPSRRKHYTQEDWAKISQLAVDYIEQVAPEHPILQDVVSREKTLESLAREKGPSFMGMGNLEDGMKAGLPDYKKSKEEHKKRRSDLCKILGVSKLNFVRGNIGFLIGGLSQATASLIYILNNVDYLKSKPNLRLLGVALSFSPFLGAMAGSKMQHYLAKRKLLKRAREVDGWIREARSQGLEGKVEDGEIELSFKENLLASLKAVAYTIPTSVPELMLERIYNFQTGPSLIPKTPFEIASTAINLGLYFGLSKYFRSKKLKQKRIAAGLPAKEEKKLRQIRQYKLEVDDIDSLKNMLTFFLEGSGLKKRFLRNSFVGEGVRLDYTEHKRYNFGRRIQGYYEIEINADSEVKAASIHNKLKNYLGPWLKNPTEPQRHEGISREEVFEKMREQGDITRSGGWDQQ